MSRRRHILIPIAGLASLGAGMALAQDNPWRIAPRALPEAGTAAEERGFTQGYLRGFEQGYRRGAEQAGNGAPTANLGARPAAPGALGHGAVQQDWLPPASAEALPPGGGHGGVLSGVAPAPGVAPGAAATRRGPGATDPDRGLRAFSPAPSRWGEFPPLDGDRPAARPAEAPARVAGPGYPYPPAAAAQPPAAAAAPAYPYAAPHYAQPYPSTTYPSTTLGAPHVAAPAGPYGYGYGYGYNPALSGPSTLHGGPFGSGFGPGFGPGIPFLGGW